MPLVCTPMGAPQSIAREQSQSWALKIQAFVKDRQSAFDVASVIIVGVVEFLVNQESAVFQAVDDPKLRGSLTFWQVAVSLSVGLPLLTRRKSPVAALVAMFALGIAAIVVTLPSFSAGAVVIWFCIQAVPLFCAGRSMRIGRVLLGIIVIAIFAYSISESFTDFADKGTYAIVRSLLTSVALITMFTGSAWLSGAYARDRVNRAELMAVRAAELEAQQVSEARQAVLDERVRIARELHDVVAHHVSLMGVQAGAARLSLTKNPQRAAIALADVEATSRTAVAEMHRLVMYLREDKGVSQGTGIADAPQPGLSDMQQLVEEAQRMGMTVRLVTNELPAVVPSSVGLSAYRIVQEALTNVRKHAGLSSPTTVELVHGAGKTEVTVENIRNDTSPVTPASTPGHGLIGMRERVGLLGGTLSAGFQKSSSGANSYVINAVLPHDSVRSGAAISERTNP
jgi:signal transduction histidine kinase